MSFAEPDSLAIMGMLGPVAGTGRALNATSKMAKVAKFGLEHGPVAAFAYPVAMEAVE